MAKCNLGNVNLEEMLSGSLWTQETRLQPLEVRKDILCRLYAVAHYRGLYKAWDGPRPSQGPFVTFKCSVLFAIIRKLILLAQSLASFTIFAQPTLPWVGLRVSCFVANYSTVSFSVTVPRWVVAASGLPWIPPSVLCITRLHQPEAPTPKLIY